jgi:mannitol/fructose-specific phosphotransferase system IIA component (Ntr-type)
VKVHALLSEGLVIPEILSQERDPALEEMARHLKNNDMVVDDGELYEKLVEREKLGSTAIGRGVAIPHCKMKGARGPLLALAVSPKGVRFEAPDGKPTHLFFLAVSSAEDPAQNLQILASIAHLVRKANALPKRIMGVKDPRRILEIIREEEEKLKG